MAVRRPLVLIDGQLAVLPAGDSLPGSGGGGGLVLSQIVLPVSTVVREEAEVVVLDAAISPSSVLMVFLVPNDDNDAGSLADDQMQVAATPEAGQIRFTLTGIGPFVGPFTVNYGVSA